MPYVFNPFTGNFDITSSAAGANSQVQFNNQGSFGSSSSFVYDEPNKRLTLNSNVTNYTTASVATYTLSDAGTGTGYSHDGDFYYWFRVYAYQLVAGTKVFSSTPTYSSVYFSGGEYNTDIVHSITAVSGAAGYLIVRSSDESSSTQPSANTFTYYQDIGNDTAFVDTNTGYNTTGSEYIPSPTTFNFANFPLRLNESYNYATDSFDVLSFGQGIKFQWQHATSCLAVVNANDATQTISANLISNTLAATTATLNNFSGTYTSGTITSSVIKAVAALTVNDFRPAIISTTTTGSNIQYAGNSALMINPGRRTVAINGAAEIGQTVSGTMLSITSQSSYAAMALKATGASGIHFFQIIDSSNVLRAMFRGDGNAIFGSTSYNNFGRATYVDNGFAGNPVAGQLSSLNYISQDDENVYGIGIGNKTYDAGNQKAAVVATALNAGGGYVGTPDAQPISLRTNNVDRLIIGGTGGVKIGSTSSSAIQDVLSATATLNFPSIGSNSTEELTLTVTGAVAGDTVALGAPSSLEASLVAFGFVSAANTVTIRLHNSGGGAVDPASATWRATVIRF